MSSIWLPQAKFVDASDLFRLIRMVKSQDEIHGLRKACELNDEAVSAMFRSAMVGATELELSAEFYKHVGGGRGTVGWQHLGSGRRSAGIFPPSAKKLERGDLLRTDVGIYLNSLHSDVCATGVLGEPTAKQKNCLLPEQKESPIVLNFADQGAARQNSSRRSIVAPNKPAWMNTKNSSVTPSASRRGNSPSSLPRQKSSTALFSPKLATYPLQENMVINVKTALVELGMGGIQIEHTLLIKKDGFEFLTAEPRHLMTI